MSANEVPAPVTSASTSSAARPGARWSGRLFRRRVPVLLQMSIDECSAACLAMVLAYHGRQTTVSECRDVLGSGRDGATAKALVQAAREQGLKARAFSVTLDQFHHIPLPAIVHWNFNHYMVVERWRSNFAEVVDPSLGRRRVSIEEFDASFTGIALTFEPAPGFQRRRLPSYPWLASLRRLLDFATLRPLFVQLVVASLLLQVLGLSLPALTQLVVDRLLVIRSGDLGVMLAAGIALVVLTQFVTAHLRSAIGIRLYAKVDQRMMLGLFERLMSLPLRFVLARSVGDLLTRLGSNVLIREVLVNRTLSALLDGSLVVAYLGLLLVQAPRLGVLALLAGAMQGLLLWSTSGKRRAVMQEYVATQAGSQGYLTEALTGFATLKASGAEPKAIAHFSDLFLQHLNASLRRSYLLSSIDATVSTFRILAPLVLLWVGAREVIEGRMTLGAMLAYNALAAAFLMPLSSLVSTLQQLQVVSASVERLSDILTATAEQDRTKVQEAPRLSGRIELRKVAFRYDRNAPLVLQDISFVVEPGKKLAIVGVTGSGKSTLGSLLIGLYEPTEGEILYDGVRLQELEYRSLRRQFGAVLQENFLFNATIRENLLFGDARMPFEEVIRAARLAGIDEEVSALPMGYETVLSAGGTGLSGGQRQRLCLARALAKRPVIMLLDEATSDLDAITEARISANLAELSCTRIVIAHRLSTIRDADQIIVLERGRIVERGRHDELVARGGRYAALVRAQMEETSSGPSARPPSEPVAPTGEESS